MDFSKLKLKLGRSLRAIVVVVVVVVVLMPMVVVTTQCKMIIYISLLK